MEDPVGCTSPRPPTSGLPAGLGTRTKRTYPTGRLTFLLVRDKDMGLAAALCRRVDRYDRLISVARVLSRLE